MTRKQILLFGGAALALLVGYLLFGRGDGAQPGMGPGARIPAGFGGPLAVQTAQVTQGPYQVSSEFVGRLRARSEAELFARVSGQIVDIPADTGDPIRAGQLLAQIDDAEARERVEQARASLRMARATVAQREATLNVAEANFRRAAELAAGDLVPQQELERVEAELASARAQLELAEAQVEQAQANLGSAELELRNTRIEAPFDGFVGRRFLDLGAFAATNRPVFSVVDLTSVRTTISVVERDVARIEVGQPATVTLEAYPGETFEGRVARIAPIFDPTTNMAEAEVEIRNPDVRLRPGMFATVSVGWAVAESALLVPREAVVDEGRESVVFVVDAGVEGSPPRARRVPVRVLGVDDQQRGLRALEADLEPGQRVVTLAPDGLRHGTPLQMAGSDMTGPEPASEARRPREAPSDRRSP